MCKKNVYYQSCIAQHELDCYRMGCVNRDKCEQFTEFQNGVTIDEFGRKKDKKGDFING